MLIDFSIKFQFTGKSSVISTLITISSTYGLFMHACRERWDARKVNFGFNFLFDYTGYRHAIAFYNQAIFYLTLIKRVVKNSIVQFYKRYQTDYQNALSLNTFNRIKSISSMLFKINLNMPFFFSRKLCKAFKYAQKKSLPILFILVSKHFPLRQHLILVFWSQ